MSAPLRVVLGEYDIGWHDPHTSLARAADLVARAAAEGADLVVLPEMSTTGFTMASAEQAEPIPGPSVRRFAELAREHGVHILAGMPSRSPGPGGEVFYNSALLFSPNGELVAEYRKQKLFVYAKEQHHYSPGEGPVVVEINGVRIALFICFDLRYPEIFREVAPEVDAIALIASWPAARRMHWDTLVRARAIENQCYVVAVNRVGEGGGLQYDGGSVAYSPWGDRLAGTAPEDAKTESGLALVEIDSDEVTRVRSNYPFLQDRRPRAAGALV